MDPAAFPSPAWLDAGGDDADAAARRWAAALSQLAPPSFTWADGPVVGRGAFGTVRLGLVLARRRGDGGSDASDGGSSDADASDGGPALGAAVAVKEIPLCSAHSWPAACREAAALVALARSATDRIAAGGRQVMISAAPPDGALRKSAADIHREKGARTPERLARARR